MARYRLSDDGGLIGKRYGTWTVLCVKNLPPWPWVWMKSDCGHYARVSVRDLDTFDCTTPPNPGAGAPVGG